MKRVWKSITAIIRSPFGKQRQGAPKAPVILPRDKHPISRKQMDPDAIKVLYRLRKFGYTSYLVGGGVRDLMLGIPAKDYDLATSAHPGQVKKIFTNCRLVGRRFRLAHILFKGKFIEVATFRKLSEYDEEGDEDILIKSDNTFGTPEEDAFRRDFTINGLFYSIENFTVIDYVDGLKDLERKLIRSIGDPNVRYREDPIRMLRAVRLAARLDFQIEPHDLTAIQRHRGEIWKGATPRILEELHRMLKEGASRRAMSILMETGLLEMLLPELSIVLVRRGQAPNFWGYLDATDRLVAGGAQFTFSVLYAALVIHLYRSKLEHTTGEINPSALADESIYPLAERLGVPKRILDRAKALILVQKRFATVGRRGFQPGPFLEKPYFREALDLFHIHALANPDQLPLYERWLRLVKPGGERPPVEGEERPSDGRRRRPRRRSRGGHRERPVPAPEQAGTP